MDGEMGENRENLRERGEREVWKRRKRKKKEGTASGIEGRVEVKEEEEERKEQGGRKEVLTWLLRTSVVSRST